MSRMTIDPEYDQAEVMAPYLPEPEQVTVDHNGVLRDDNGAAFDDDTYWLVAHSRA